MAVWLISFRLDLTSLGFVSAASNEERDHMEIGGEDVGYLMNVDIGTELDSLRSFGAKGKTLVEESGGHAFREFDVELSPREGPSGR